MNRIRRCVPVVLAASALALVVVGFTTEALGGPLWRIGLVLATSIGCTIGWFRHRLPAIFPIGVAVGGLRIVAMDSAPLVERRDTLGLFDLGTSAVVGIGLLAMTATAMRYRRGELDRRDSIDFVTVAIGASMCAWLLVASPLRTEFGAATATAVLVAGSLVIGVLLLTFIVDLLLSGLQSNIAMRLIAMAAAANLAAAAVSTLGVVELFTAPRHSGIALFAASFALAAAALSHPAAVETFIRAETNTTATAYTPFRLGLTAACLVVPGLLVATVAPSGTLDVAVRTVAMATLVAAVITRLHVALANHEGVRQELLNRLHRDELTDLPTRARFVQILSDDLEATWRSDRRPTIIQLNLDRFKNINDSLGHDDANRVLVAVARRLEAAADEFAGIVARIGGDDFVIVDSSTSNDEETMDRVAAIRETLSGPVTVGEHTVFVTTSIGVAVAPRNRTINAEELLRRADIATNTAKSAGRSGLTVFDDSMQAHLAHRMDVEQALHGAIGRQEMRLYHQPIVDIATGRVSGFEALIRWQRDGAIISPAEFIPIAEETGTINELGEWALNDALRELRGWIDDGVVTPDTTVSVNVSPRQVADPNFASIVRNALESNGMPSNLLWLEMTESMMLDEPELAEKTLRTIREMGVRLALDDFGTGYSSLSLLQQFPIQRIKIDRAFVQGIAEQGNDRSLVRTIIAMAQSMGLDLVAEGVETVHQLQTLADLSCDKAQGFLISHPVPADAMRSTMVALDELTSLSLFAGSPARQHDLVGIGSGASGPTVSLGPGVSAPAVVAR